MKTNGKILQFLSLTVIMAFLLLPLNTNAQGGKANFSGTWALNAEKSNFGQPPAQAPGQGQGQGGGQRMGGGNFVATQEANLLTVVRTRTGQDGQPVTTTMIYTLDGKESVNTSARGNSKSVATWSADGKALSIATTRTIDINGESREMKSNEVWTLTDAKTISIVTTSTTPNGERKTTAVYDKK